MKSARLSNSLREQILDQMMKGYDDQNPSPTTETEAENLAADALWALAFGKYDFSNIPEKFLKKSSRLSAQICDDYVSFRHSEKKFYVMDDRYSPVPVKNFSKQPAFYKKYLKQISEYEKWQEARSGFQMELSSILWSVNTSRQLVDIWPESETYLPQGIAETITRNLPALKTEELNKKLGISALTTQEESDG